MLFTHYVFEAMTDRNLSLLQVAKELNMPRSRLATWLRRKWPDELARARQDWADRMFEEIQAEAAAPLYGDAFDGIRLQRAKLSVDALKWSASRLAPHLYGEKVEHLGNAGGALVVQIVNYAEIAACRISPSSEKTRIEER